VVEHRGLPKEVKRRSKQMAKIAKGYAPASKGAAGIPNPKPRKEIQMITVVLKALARGKLTALAVVATLIVVTASAAVATNPPMSVESSTNEDEFNTEQQLDAAANSSQVFSQAIYAKQLTSTGRNLQGDDREDDGRQVAAVACDEGDAVLSGGHFKVDKGTTLVSSGPNPRHNSWKLVWINEETEDSIGVKVLCADMGTPDTVPAPEGAAPEGTTPETTAPESASPEASASATASPEASDPAATSPEAAAPEGTTLEASASATVPSEASASPEASVPEVSVPNVTPPEGVPE
jgi:hypothetical protein